MTEGLGLNLSERFDEILEQKRGHEILNFGSGGDLGPLSYYLIYKDLASKFEHENLFIFFFHKMISWTTITKFGNTMVGI